MIETRLFAYLPLPELPTQLDYLLQHRLQPELSLRGPELDRLDLAGTTTAVARLAEAGLAVTLHAPFFDLSPASPETELVELSRRRCRQALELAERWRAKVVVFHPGYDPWRFRQLEPWLEQAVPFWRPLVEQAGASGCVAAFENIFDRDPSPLAGLLAGLGHPAASHCFDVGHWRLFAHCPLAEWFQRLGGRMRHLHLHDNHGVDDDHLPIGDGTIDFDALVAEIGTLPSPPTYTLEAHDQPRLHRSLTAFRRLFVTA